MRKKTRIQINAHRRFKRYYKQVEGISKNWTLSSEDRENFVQTFTLGGGTKRGLNRSRKMLNLFQNGNYNQLLRYKEFQRTEHDDFNPSERSLSMNDFFNRIKYRHWKDSQSAFMKDNQELTKSYNDLSPEEKLNENNPIVKQMKKRHNKFQYNLEGKRTKSLKNI